MIERPLLVEVLATQIASEAFLVVMQIEEALLIAAHLRFAEIAHGSSAGHGASAWHASNAFGALTS